MCLVNHVSSYIQVELYANAGFPDNNEHYQNMPKNVIFLISFDYFGQYDNFKLVK